MSKNGTKETIRDRILKVYGLLFCEDTGEFMKQFSWSEFYMSELDELEYDDY